MCGRNGVVNILALGVRTLAPVPSLPASHYGPVEVPDTRRAKPHAKKQGQSRKTD